MDKRFFFVLMMTIITMIAFNFFLHRGDKPGGAPASMQAGQSYKIPSKEELMRPLNREVDFLDKETVQLEQITEVETDLWKLSFSSHGGTLVDTSFKKRLGRGRVPLKTLLHNADIKEDRTFLLGLEEKTPYFYKMVSKEDRGDTVAVTYESSSNGWTLKKTYNVYKDQYKVDLKFDAVASTGASVIRPRLFVKAPFIEEVPTEGQTFVVHKIPGEVQTGFVYSEQGQSIDFIADTTQDNAWFIPKLFGASDKYFAHALIGDASQFTQRAYYKKGALGRLVSVYEGPEIKDRGSFDLSFYMGPKDLGDMVVVDKRLEGVLNFGWWSWICKFLVKAMEFLHKYISNYGLVIIVLTILIKIPLLPLSMKGAGIMEKHQKYQPQLAYIKQKYKNDVRVQQQEIMRFYKEHNLSPAGQLYGCLPMLLDIPIMFALYRVLGNYMDLYQAPFVLWITDLSSRDPYYVLPVLMGVAMLWQQMLAPAGDDKQKIMGIFMPLIFTGICINFASGLVLYWLTKTVLTVGETYLRKSLARR